MESKTKHDSAIRRLKNNPVIVTVLLVVTFVVGFSIFTDSLDNLATRFGCILGHDSPESTTQVTTASIRDDSNADISPHTVIPVNHSTRVYMTLTPREMMNSIKDMTSFQANEFISSVYAGKWWRICGPLFEVSGSLSTNNSKSTGYCYVVFVIDGITTRIFMNSDQCRALTHLRKGDQVTVDGVFRDIDYAGPDFDQGELVREK